MQFPVTARILLFSAGPPDRKKPEKNKIWALKNKKQLQKYKKTKKHTNSTGIGGKINKSASFSLEIKLGKKIN